MGHCYANLCTGVQHLLPRWQTDHINFLFIVDNYCTRKEKVKQNLIDNDNRYHIK